MMSRVSEKHDAHKLTTAGKWKGSLTVNHPACGSMKNTHGLDDPSLVMAPVGAEENTDHTRLYHMLDSDEVSAVGRMQFHIHCRI